MREPQPMMALSSWKKRGAALLLRSRVGLELQKSVDFNELVVGLAHAELAHVFELVEAMARFDALDEVVVVALVVDHVDRGLINGEDVG